MLLANRCKNLYRLLVARHRMECDLDEEVNTYFDIMEERYVEAGMSREEAYRKVRVDLEQPEQVKQKVRNQRFGNTIESILKDVRLSARALRKNPGFAMVVICSLAIGIGANTAVFSFADWWILRPLPVQEPNRIAAVRPDTSAPGAAALDLLSYPDYVEVRDHNHAFAGLIAQAYSPFGFASSSGTQARMKFGMYVSGNFFSVLGVDPVIGRGFRREEDVPGSDEPVVVISHELWASEYAKRSVIGQRLWLNGIQFTIIGVAPERFTGTDQFMRPALYVPLAMSSILGSSDNLHLRQVRWLTVKGRLAPGKTIAQAQADLNTIVNALENQYPTVDGNLRLKVETQLEFQSEFSPPTMAFLTMLTLLALSVLLVACANVGGLLLSRSSTLSREVALRLAIGAGRISILRRLLIECLMLALAGGALGLAVAFAGVRLFRSLPPPSSDLPLTIGLHLDLRALLFTAAISILCTFAFGLSPAIRLTRANLILALKTGDGASSQSTKLRLRKILTVGQVALSVVLLIVGCVLIDGFRSELMQGPGFRTDSLFLMSFNPSLVHYTDEKRDQFYKRLLSNARRSPGVKSATLAAVVPLAFGATMIGVVPDGYSFQRGQKSVTVFDNVVTDRYFETMGIPLLVGRGISESDSEKAPAVAVVNEQFVRRFWPNENPLGKSFRLSGAAAKVIHVVGVAKTTKSVFIAEPPLDVIYLPLAQNPQPQMTLIVEARSPDATQLDVPIREVVSEIDPNMPVFGERTMKNLYQDRAIKTPRLITHSVAGMGLMGMILAIVGLYGLMSFSVALRTREIGIRMALGADQRAVVTMIMKQGLGLVALGAGIGFAIGISAYRVIESKLVVSFGTPGMLPFGMITLLLLIATSIAAFVPARHASGIDPLRALRDE